MAKSLTKKMPQRSARQSALDIARILRGAGHIAYLAGGCVRDPLLGLQPKDYDVATDAHPPQVRVLFPKAHRVGEAFGVMLVRNHGHFVEVATFRTEWGYQDGRHPDKIEFSDAEHDAQRRDFTINGLFQNPASGRIIDYIGGRKDIVARQIRAIGDPDRRFDEDFLRMLRAVRFAANLRFRIERKTAAAIRRHAGQLAAISRERIGQELQLMLEGPRPPTAIRTLNRLGLDEPALTEPHNPQPVPTVAALQPGSSYPCTLAAWMLDRHAQKNVDAFVRDHLKEVLRRWRRALCLSNEHFDELRITLRHLPAALNWGQLSVARRKRLLAKPVWPNLWSLLRALRHGLNLTDMMRGLRHDVRQLLKEGVCPPPVVNGNDLIAVGRKPGPEFSRLLDQVYDLQLEGRLVTRQDALDWLESQP